MERKKCSVEVFSRVTGFFRPVQSWNPGKEAEFKDRKSYVVPGTSDRARPEQSAVETESANVDEQGGVVHSAQKSDHKCLKKAGGNLTSANEIVYIKD